jgi:nucleolar protein 53
MKRDQKSRLCNASLQDSLNQAANERRLGTGVLLQEQQNTDLFTVDTQGSAEITREYKVKKLRIDEILKPSSAFSLQPTRIQSSKATKKLPKIPKPSKEPNPPAKQQATPSLELWNEEENSSPAELKPAKKTLSVCKAVPLPHPGQSYRPQNEDLQQAIEIAASTILKKEAEACPKITIVPSSLSEDASIIQANRNLFNKQPEEESETEEPSSSTPSSTASALKRKTKAQKNKKNRHFELQKAINQAKLFKASDKQINNLSTILSLIKKTSSKCKVKEAKKNARLGKYKIVERMMDVLLPEEVPDSLRTLAPEGNLVKDRFVSLQQRNLIEPRVKVQPWRRYAMRTVIENK